MLTSILLFTITYDYFQSLVLSSSTGTVQTAAFVGSKALTLLLGISGTTFSETSGVLRIKVKMPPTAVSAPKAVIDAGTPNID